MTSSKLRILLVTDTDKPIGQMREALACLGVMPRAVIFLKLREGMTNDEIASHLGITKRMVKRHLVSGYAELRARLIPE